jgi:TonB-dependent receptor
MTSIRRFPSALRCALRAFLGCLSAAAILGLATAASAQVGATGAVAGVASNAKTGETLEGATVTLAGGAPGSAPFTTYTTRGGGFVFGRVPPGSYTVTISYAGLDDYSASVSVMPGRTSNVSAAMTTEVYKMQAFSVQGVREGNAAAIMQQKNAPNIVTMLSTEAYGDVAEGNLANMIQNVPGIAVVNQAGDYTGVTIGGVPPELSTINVNGVRMASALVGSSGGMGDRVQMFDRIPADFIQKIEITMGSMPDQMADSLAGSANLITKSGFDVAQNVFNYRLGVTRAGYFKEMRNRYRPTGGVTYIGALGKDRKLAFSISASYNGTLYPSQNISTSHSDVHDARASGARMLSDLNAKRRDGISGQVDYKFMHDTAHAWFQSSISFFSFINDRINWQASAGNRNFADYSVVSLADIEAGAAPKTSSGAAAGLAPGYDPNVQSVLLDPNITDDAQHEDRRGHYYVLAGGVTKEWGDSKATVSASWNPTSFDDDYYGMTVNYNNMPVGIMVDSRTNLLLPLYSQTFGPSLAAGKTTYGKPWFARWFKQPDTERQTVSDVKGDFERKFDIAGLQHTFKVGVEYRDEINWYVKSYRPVWNFTGNGGDLTTVMPQILSPASSSRGVFNNVNPAFVWNTINFTSAKALFNLYPQYWTPLVNGSVNTVATPPTPGDFAEFVTAYYLMDTFQIGKLNVLAGVRHEHTTVEAQGSYSDPNLPTVSISHVAGGYDYNFPSIHLKYDATKRLVLKASYSTTSARPNYSVIVPNTTVNNQPQTSGYPGTVVQSNPGMKPDYARALEGAIEFYFKPAGLLSFSYFHREISNFNTTIQGVIPSGASNGFNGLYAGYLLTTSANLSSIAHDDGYQINYIQQFPWLPKPFNGLQVFANTTIQKSSGTFPGGAAILPFFSPRLSNVGVIYSIGKLTARFTWHDHSYFLQSYSTNPASMGWQADQPTEDVNITYEISPKLTLFFDGVNIRDKDYIAYNVDLQTRNTNLNDNGRRFNFGISGRF